MLEFLSTITNSAFIIVGLIIYKRSWYVGITTLLVGVTSAGWHWTLHPAWQSLDLIMIYMMLISLINYIAGSVNTTVTFLVGLGITGLYFLLSSSHLIIAGIAVVLLFTLTRYYPPGRIFIIVGWFILWIGTNIPYLHNWEVPFLMLDVLHGISHICASIGIYKTVQYRLR